MFDRAVGTFVTADDKFPLRGEAGLERGAMSDPPVGAIQQHDRWSESSPGRSFRPIARHIEAACALQSHMAPGPANAAMSGEGTYDFFDPLGVTLRSTHSAHRWGLQGRADRAEELT